MNGLTRLVYVVALLCWGLGNGLSIIVMAQANLQGNMYTLAICSVFFSATFPILVAFGAGVERSLYTPHRTGAKCEQSVNTLVKKTNIFLNIPSNYPALDDSSYSLVDDDLSDNESH
jgi:hypothetical protein